MNSGTVKVKGPYRVRNTPNGVFTLKTCQKISAHIKTQSRRFQFLQIEERFLKTLAVFVTD